MVVTYIDVKNRNRMYSAGFQVVDLVQKRLEYIVWYRNGSNDKKIRNGR